MIKFVGKVKEEYTETPQVNPLRWRTLFRKDEEVFERTSSIFKCKDYFNDMVLARVDKCFGSVYGFNNKKEQNKEGLYVEVIYTTDKFLENLKVLNQWCADTSRDGHKTCVDYVGVRKERVVLLLPDWVMSSTYYVSLVTYLIRCCNYDKVFDSVECMIKFAFVAGDKPIFGEEKKILSIGCNLPTKQKRTYFNYSLMNHKPTAPHQVHNNGVQEWFTYLDMEKA